MNFFHISHTDLDGYGCQLISKKIFPNGKYYNANYGLEVKTNIDTVLQYELQSSNSFLLIHLYFYSCHSFLLITNG